MSFSGKSFPEDFTTNDDPIHIAHENAPCPPNVNNQGDAVIEEKHINIETDEAS